MRMLRPILWLSSLVIAVIILSRFRSPLPAVRESVPDAPVPGGLQRTVVEIKAVEKMIPPPPTPVPSPPEEAMSAKSQPKAADSSEGRVIPIVADYRRHLGFPTYVREMKKIGAMFLLFDPIREKLIAEVDIPRKTFRPVNTDRLQSMSPNIREISNEIAVEELQLRAKTEYGLPICSIIMLLPIDVDRRMAEKIVAQLQAGGIDPARTTSVLGEYLLRAGVLCLRISSIDATTGTVSLPFEVRL
jgi:hypothetical protein